MRMITRAGLALLLSLAAQSAFAQDAVAHSDAYKAGEGFGFIILVSMAVGYFIPSIVAFTKNHSSKWVILAANFAIGWTVIGWFVCFIWALSSGNKPSIDVKVMNVNGGGTINGDRGEKDNLDKIAQLATMRDSGIISEEEFAAQKKKLLG